MKKKFIVFSDQHLEAKLYNIPELEQDNRDLFKQVIDTAIELGVDYLISTGDMFDNNNPRSETIEFVKHQVERCKAAKIRPLAIAGDHSKSINGSTWERICGFEPISSVPEFIGVDYLDNPAEVTSIFNDALRRRPPNTVEFLFMHQQLIELWPFCDEKKQISLKDIDLSNHCGSIQAVFLGDIHIRREMKYFDIACDKELFVGYCGSLGVTASDETKKEGLYYWDGDTLQLIEYSLPREFVVLDLTKESLAGVRREVLEQYKNSDKSPVFICKLAPGLDPEDKLDFLHEIGYVRTSRVRKGADGAEEMINIRSELKTADRYSSVLKVLLKDNENYDVLYDTAYKILTNPDDITSTLDELSKQINQPA
jgi:hypothetical protein